MARQGGTSYDVININVTDDRNHTNDGRADRKGRIRNKNGEAIMKYNFKSIAAAGLALRWARMGSEAIGSYTGRRMQQQKRQATMTMMSYAIGIKVAGPFGVLYTAADIGYRNFNHQVNVLNRNVKAEINAERSGNATRLGSRSRGDKL